MEWFISVFAFAFTSTVTPGPNNVMIMTSGLNHGVERSLPHLCGICLGFPLMVLLVGLGFGAVFERFEFLHWLIKIVGVLYLLYLAWQIANSAPTSLNGESKPPFSFLQAAAFQWVNPKAWVMATGAVAAYTSISADIWWQVGWIVAAFALVAFPCVGAWLVFGVLLKRWLSKPSQQRLFNWSMALLLVLSILPVVAEMLGLLD
ncbi:LysE family translocator [Paraferrimonas sedimenticola]|uniref:Lysine transporter LysE n=1 Tax=Paraferrimonas sedimenticola TaxID=375674 RepID=A0AA37VT15_9GAMM|nr:LysE family translocator [Paraferrimonas sedimenticola]GLP95109.1 lysine transporter LysE [Paraferrimonas sedimenticola]